MTPVPQQPKFESGGTSSQCLTVASGVSCRLVLDPGPLRRAKARIAEDGAVTVMEGSPDIGGSRASMALMAAETLGVPYERVKAHVGDTEATGFCNVTGGSRTTFATGMAVIQACEDIIAQCKQRAALTWDLDEEQVDWVDGEAVPKPGVNADVNPLSLADIARGAGRTGGPLLGRASLNAQGAGASFSCNFTDTKVDTETGKVDVLSFTAVQDAGRAIHPSYVEGQMQGGAVQGIGWALNEEYIYDADGVMENAGFLDYRVPVASDMPMIDTEIIEVPNPFHPYGVRAASARPRSWPRWRRCRTRSATSSGSASTTCRCRRRGCWKPSTSRGGRVALLPNHRAAQRRRAFRPRRGVLSRPLSSLSGCSHHRLWTLMSRSPTNPRRSP